MIELAKLQAFHQQWLLLIEEAMQKKEKITDFLCSVRRAIDTLAEQKTQNPWCCSIQVHIEEQQNILQNGMVLFDALKQIISEFEQHRVRVERLIDAWRPGQHSPSI